MQAAIVLFSGGLDSTACLYWAKEKYERIIILSFLYGSKEDETIKRINERFSSYFNFEAKLIEVPFLAEFSKNSGSSLSEEEKGPPEILNFEQLDDKDITDHTAEQVWVPGRNLLFLSIAASLADSLTTPVDIIFGANKEEGETFPDNTYEFVERMNNAIGLGCKNQVSIQAPFAELSKTDIVKFLHDSKAQVNFSSSCYQVKEWTLEGNPVHCGKCESCQRRKRAYSSAKIEDPTEYHS